MKKLLGRRILFLLTFLALPLCADATVIDIYQDTVVNGNIEYMSVVNVHNSAYVTVQSAGVAFFNLLDMSTTDVYGGMASYTAQDSSILNLYGGTYGYVRYTNDLSKIYVYGKNFHIDPASDNHTSVFLVGNWLDENETAFSIYFRGLPQPFEQALGINIFLIPEPISISLLLFGILGIKKFRG